MRIGDLNGEKVGLCVSGGLDSKTIAHKLTELGVDVLCFSANLAQADEADINDIRAKMAPCGVDTVIVDLRRPMAEACMETILAQATYDGGYWNSTGVARAVTVRGLVPEMKKHGCTVLGHGATGRGNDQMRFERYTNVLAPDMKVYAPWRDPDLLAEFPGRTQMVEYLNDRGIEAFPGGRMRYSTDANLAGLSYEAEELESLTTPSAIVEPVMGVWPQDAPDKSEVVAVRFESGIAQGLNGEPLDALDLMMAANAIAGRNGVGIKSALENRIIGTKSRGVYEAPGMELLGACLRLVYQAVMNRQATNLFADLSRLVAEQIYCGRAYDPATRAAMAAIRELASAATAAVEVELYKGTIRFQALRDCPASLYNEADSSMEASAGLNPASSRGYAEIQGVEARALARAGQIHAG